MTTFTTEDRLQFENTQEPTWEEKWGSWAGDIQRGWGEYNQTKIEFFWPLTEQIGLELDFEGCDTKSSLYYPSSGNIGQTIAYNGTSLTWATVPANPITPQLTITPNNPSGYMSIGGVNIGLEKKPNIFQRLIHRLLGFDWKDK